MSRRRFRRCSAAGVIEVDTFCTGCYYNLHGQIVTVDERLGIPICRCPECGRFHPAGTGVTASNVWIRRFASILLFSWIVIVLASMLAASGAMMGLDGLSIGMQSDGYEATPDGKPVVYMANGTGGGGFIIVGTTIPAPQMAFYRRLRAWNDSSDPYEPGAGAMITLSLGSALAGFIAATLFVTLLWHWPRSRYVWIVLMSLIPAFMILLIFFESDQYKFIHLQVAERIFCQAGFQCFGALLGILLGRKLARQIARTIIPPKPRQVLAYLWLVDGKKPPVVDAMRVK